MINYQNKENIKEDTFDAKIKKVSEYNGITTILIGGIETNDINRADKKLSVLNLTKM